MDLARALLLQVEWGADEALEPQPRSHLLASTPAAAARAAAGSAAGSPRRAEGSPSPLQPAGLQELLAALAAHDGAGLARTATHLVAPVGKLGGLMVVGEAPGAAEDRVGAAFVGDDGQLLRRMLASVGLSAAEAMLAYLSPWRPPGGRAPTQTEVAACLPLLHALIGLARPRLLLTLGTAPSRALVGEAARRGRWADAAIPGLDQPVRLLPTCSPAVLLQQPQQKRAAWSDLRLLRRRWDELTVS